MSDASTHNDNGRHLLVRRRHAASRPQRAQRPTRRVLGTTGLAAGAVVLALMGAGGTYALWSGTAAVNASSISSGSTAVTVNGQQSAPLSLDTTRLAPGIGVATALTVANAGDTAVDVTVSTTTVTSDPKAVAGDLTAVLTPVATAGACAPGLTGGTAARLSSFATTTPLSLAAGASGVWCLEIKLDADAPASVQGGSTAFTVAVSALQKAV